MGEQFESFIWYYVLPSSLFFSRMNQVFQRPMHGWTLRNSFFMYTMPFQPAERNAMNPVQILSSLPCPFFAVLDGPCGSGKTTLAAHLEQRIPNLFVVHMDDYYIPMVQKTTSRLAIPGGNADSERLLREVLEPHFAGRDAVVRPYRCHEDTFLPSWILPHNASLLLEGSYSTLPAIASRADLSIYLTISPAEQKNRILQRDGADSFSRYITTWISVVLSSSQVRLAGS